MEVQETQNRKNSLEKEEQSWRTHTSLFQNLLQINQDTIVLAVRTDIWPMKQNWESREKRLHLWSTHFWPGCRDHRWGRNRMHSGSEISLLSQNKAGSAPSRPPHSSFSLCWWPPPISCRDTSLLPPRCSTRQNSGTESTASWRTGWGGGGPRPPWLISFPAFQKMYYVIFDT